MVPGVNRKTNPCGGIWGLVKRIGLPRITPCPQSAARYSICTGKRSYFVLRLAQYDWQCFRELLLSIKPQYIERICQRTGGYVRRDSFLIELGVIVLCRCSRWTYCPRFLKKRSIEENIKTTRRFGLVFCFAFIMITSFFVYLSTGISTFLNQM